MFRPLLASLILTAGLAGAAHAESGATPPPAKTSTDSKAATENKKAEPGSKTAGSASQAGTTKSGPANARHPSSAKAGTAKATTVEADAADAVPAGPPAPVYCGSYTPFHFRVTALGKDPSTRANFAMDIINKYLGGRMGKVTTQPAGKNTRLLLNNELLAVITPADALAEHQKTSVALASKWARMLSTAFEASKAQR